MSLQSCLDLIESVRDYKVLFIGESITDEYHYVTPLGKSPKEYLIPVLFEEAEIFEGGVRAAAKHCQSFVKQVDICTSTPLRKVRFVQRSVEGKSLKKLFEVHYDEPFLPVNGWGDDYDVVVVTDFGHRRITLDIIGKLCKLPYLALCTQTNASNIGFNLLTRYPRADYIVMDEPEARLAAADRDGYIRNVMDKLSQGRCDKMIVTHGYHGAYGLQNDIFLEQPAFSGAALDTMGAGDAFFSVTAPMSKNGNIDDLMVIGHAAGHLKVEILGHRESVTKEHLIQFLKENL